MAEQLLWIHHAPIQKKTQEIVGSGTDRSLSEYGLKVARSMAEVLHIMIDSDALSEPDSTILSSPLVRSTQTAEIIAARLGFDIQTDDRLKAQFFGDLEGRTIPELERSKRLKPYLYRYIDPVSRFDSRAAGEGESVSDVWVRAMDIRRESFETAQKGRFIITHGTVLDTIIGSIRALKHWDWDGVNREYPRSVIVDKKIEMDVIPLIKGDD